MQCIKLKRKKERKKQVKRLREERESTQPNTNLPSKTNNNEKQEASPLVDLATVRYIETINNNTFEVRPD